MTTRSRNSRWVVMNALGLSLLVACSPSSEASGDVGQGPAPEGAIEIVMEDSGFEPEILELPAGEEVTVQLTNLDDMPHDFAIEQLDLNTGTIEAEESAYATFTVPEEAMKFLCTFHRGMEGRVQPQ